MEDKKHGKRALDEIGTGHGAGMSHDSLHKIEDHSHKKRHL